MYISVAGMKGGIGKTTTAIHLAHFLNQYAPTLLIDGDPNRSATLWASNGKLDFPVVGEHQGFRESRNYEHVIRDTKARPDAADLKEIGSGCDLLIVPTTPGVLAADALMLTITALRNIGSENYAVLVTIVPPRPNRDGEETARALREAGIPVFNTMIRRYIAYERAAALGVPVDALQEGNAQAAWQDYIDAGKEMLG